MYIQNYLIRHIFLFTSLTLHINIKYFFYTSQTTKKVLTLNVFKCRFCNASSIAGLIGLTVFLRGEFWFEICHLLSATKVSSGPTLLSAKVSSEASLSRAAVECSLLVLNSPTLLNLGRTSSKILRGSLGITQRDTCNWDLEILKWIKKCIEN